MRGLVGGKSEVVQTGSRVWISPVSGAARAQQVGIGLISRPRLASILHRRGGDGWRGQFPLARDVGGRDGLLVETLL
jgi:hypothetical protein